MTNIPIISPNLLFTWHTDLQVLSFRFWTQTPPLTCICKYAAPHCLCAILLHPPFPSTIAHHHFIWHTHNRATITQFRCVDSNLTSWPCIVKMCSLPTISLPFSHTHTSQHHHLLPFYTAHPKLSHYSSVSGFWLKSYLLTLHL